MLSGASNVYPSGRLLFDVKYNKNNESLTSNLRCFFSLLQFRFEALFFRTFRAEDSIFISKER